MGQMDATAKARQVWNAQAPRYDQAIRFWERVWFGAGRPWVCSRARGEVLEVAVGTGRNFEFYPPGVKLTGVDLSPAMLQIAHTRAGALGREVDLLEADAQALPFDDASFDTVVSTLSLCGIPDERMAIAEMSRVLRPGGRLLLLDHIGSSWWPLRAGQRLVEFITVRTAGEHMTRRPRPFVEAAGFQIEEAERLKAGTIERLAATKPVP